MSETKEESAELIAMCFEESDEVRAAHLLYEDLKSTRLVISKFDFYLIAQDARGGYDGTSECGNLGWTLRLKQAA